MKDVYVVFKIGEDGMEGLRVFNHSDDAKWFVKVRPNEGWRIWQQEVLEKYDYVGDLLSGKVTFGRVPE